jgi:hypothetical protein
VIINFLYNFFRFCYVSDDPLCFRLIQWNPAPTPAANAALPDNSSESYNYSPLRYDERDALRFKADRDESRRELGEVSRKPASLSSNGSVSANSYWRPLTVNPLIDSDPIQLLN